LIFVKNDKNMAEKCCTNKNGIALDGNNQTNQYNRTEKNWEITREQIYANL